MREFLVESYLGRGDAPQLAAAAERLRAAAAALADEGRAVSWLRSSFVDEDEICLHWFRAPSDEAVREAAVRARVACDRVVAANTVEGERA